MSNLTCASGQVSASSGSRIEAGNMYTQVESFASTDQASVPAKKRRNLPGNPDPNAEVIALSPNSLLATNKYICEICNKGFQRDQNLQLHKRGHNLPWKLKQRITSKDEIIRKKVYVCPEATCVHHDPSRALGDLTGIKKHFSRKHGEKKWKCEKCSKKYAVKSDLKAHSKICGTREYRCDCGKVFSRRDSFITHRAFCDVLAEESANPALHSSQQIFAGSSSTHHHHMLNLPSQLQINHGSFQTLPSSSSSSVKMEQNQHHNIFNPRPDFNNIPTPWPLDLSSSPLYSGSSSLNHIDQNPNSTNLQHPTAAPHMSATAILQKAAQMGATKSKPSPLLRPHQHQAAHMSENNTAAGSGLVLSSREEFASGFAAAHAMASFENKATVTSGNCMEQFAVSTACSGAGAASPAPPLLHDMMTTTCLSPGIGFDEALNYGVLDPKKHSNEKRDHGNIRGSYGLTRDFLGLKAFPDQRDQFINITGLDYMNPPPSSTTYA